MRRRPVGLNIDDFSITNLQELGLAVDANAIKSLKAYPTLAAVRYMRSGGLTPLASITPTGIVVPSPLPFRAVCTTPQQLPQFDVTEMH